MGTPCLPCKKRARGMVLHPDDRKSASLSHKVACKAAHWRLHILHCGGMAFGRCAHRISASFRRFRHSLRCGASIAGSSTSSFHTYNASPPRMDTSDKQNRLRGNCARLEDDHNSWISHRAVGMAEAACRKGEAAAALFGHSCS